MKGINNMRKRNNRLWVHLNDEEYNNALTVSGEYEGTEINS